MMGAEVIGSQVTPHLKSEGKLMETAQAEKGRPELSLRQ